MKIAPSTALHSTTITDLSVFRSLLKSEPQPGNPKSPLLLFRHLLNTGSKPDDFTFSLLFKSSISTQYTSNSLPELNQIHAHLVKSGIDEFIYVTTALLDFYAKLGCIDYAQKVFNYMPERDAVSWNALIYGFSRNRYDYYALETFVWMLREGLTPSGTTLVGLVPSCGRHELRFRGRSVHGLGVKLGLDLDFQVKNALISMYGKGGDLFGAEVLFEEVREKSVVSWNAMIGAYNQNGLFDKGMLVFKRMVEERAEVNPVTVMNLLLANTNPVSTHCYMIKTGLVCAASVVTSLVCSYAKCAGVQFAELLFQSLRMKNLVSLTAILSSYAEMGNMSQVVDCYSRMQLLDMKLDSVAMVGILHGIADTAYMNLGLAFHGHAFKTGLDDSTLVANGLISMYSKFGDIEAVFSLLDKMNEKNLITWNSAISGCVQAGRASDAIEVFCQMKMLGRVPDAITVASLLSGCSQLGYLQFGERLHNYVLRNNFDVEDFVGTALIDMYTKCGSVTHAERVFNSIKEPCLATWNTMISGYSWFGFEQKAVACYSKIQEQGLKPDKITFLGILAACTHGGLVDEGKRFFHIMTKELHMKPTLQHSACMVALLGRAGLFEDAILFIKNMEAKPDSAVWGALLSACFVHQEVKLGECLAKKLYLLDHTAADLFVMMSNLYAVAERWDDVARVRKIIRGNGGDGCSGVSQIEATSLENQFGMTPLKMNQNLFRNAFHLSRDPLQLAFS